MTIKSTFGKLSLATVQIFKTNAQNKKGKNTHFQECDEFGRIELLRPHGL